MSLGRHILPGQHLSQEQKVHGEAAGNRDSLGRQLLEGVVRRIAPDHDDGTGAMPERDDFYRHLLVGQVHDQRRQHVRRLNAARHQGFFDLGPAAVLAVLVFEARLAGSEGALLRALETHATGSVRLQVTGSPPTTNGSPLAIPPDPFPQDSALKGKAAAISPCNTCLRFKAY